MPNKFNTFCLSFQDIISLPGPPNCKKHVFLSILLARSDKNRKQTTKNKPHVHPAGLSPSAYLAATSTRAIAILQICRRGSSYLLNTPSHPAMMKMSTKLEWCISDVLRFTHFDSKKRMYLSRPGKNDLADSWWLMNQKFVEQPGPSHPFMAQLGFLFNRSHPWTYIFWRSFQKKIVDSYFTYTWK